MKLIARLSIALAALAAVAVPFAFAGTSSGRTIEFVSVQQRFAAVPPIHEGAPPQVGGRFVFQDLAYNRGPQFGKPAGALVGRAEGVCTLVSSVKPEAQCLITAHVPNGQIIVAAEGDPGAKVTHYAVIGGLGAYTKASGTVTGTALSDTKTLVVIHLNG
jgi:hypothetical protein